MADTKVADLPASGALSGPEKFYIDNAGTDNFCTSTQIKTFSNGAVENTMYFQLDYDSNAGSYRAMNIGASGADRATFAIPKDFVSLVSLEMVFWPEGGAAGSGKDIDLTSEYAASGELKDFHSETDTTTTYNLGTADTLNTYSLAAVFSSLAAEDSCGILIDHKGIGGAVKYLFVKLVYNT